MKVTPTKKADMKQTLSIFYFARFLDKREVFVHKGNKRLPHGGEDFTKTNLCCPYN